MIVQPFARYNFDTPTLQYNVVTIRPYTAACVTRCSCKRCRPLIPYNIISKAGNLWTRCTWCLVYVYKVQCCENTVSNRPSTVKLLLRDDIITHWVAVNRTKQRHYVHLFWSSGQEWPRAGEVMLPSRSRVRFLDASAVPPVFSDVDFATLRPRENVFLILSVGFYGHASAKILWRFIHRHFSRPFIRQTSFFTVFINVYCLRKGCRSRINNVVVNEKDSKLYYRRYSKG